MERESAIQVAITSSGHTVTAIVAAGTRIPPIPKPASISMAIATWGLVGLAAARAPPKAAMKGNSLDSET